MLEEFARQLSQYRRLYPQETEVVNQFAALLHESPRPRHRENYAPGHLTASAFVFEPSKKRVALILHTKLQRWLQPGGHIEQEDRSLCAAAEREVREECGFQSLDLAQEGLFDIDIHTFPARSKAGSMTPEHLHFDVRFAFLTRDALVGSDEVSDARWVECDQVSTLCNEESVLRPIRKWTTLC